MTPGVVAESDLAGTLKSEYVFFGGERVARRDLVAPAGVFYYFSDYLKTASVITDATGNIQAESDYYPWGGELQFVNNDSNHYKFTGKERDSETGLDLMGSRYYGSAFGRFVTADPLSIEMHRLIDPQQLNLYAYGRNNPLRFSDPTGLDIAVKCADQANCKTATDQVNGRKNGKFEVAIGKDGKWHPVGKVDASKLKGAEKAFYNALTDTKTHATLSVVSGDGKVFFGTSTGKGANTVDVADTSQLAGAGLSPGTAVAHEAMEAYATAADPNYAADPNASRSAAHRNDPFPGFTLLGGGGHAVVEDGNLTGYQYTLRDNGTQAQYQVNTTLETPIPTASFVNPQTRAAAQQAISEKIVSVTPK